MEASLIGYELIYVDKKKKLTKIYTNEESTSYNVSIALDSANKIIELQILQIIWGKDNEAEMAELDKFPDKVNKYLDLDMKKITEM
ncbi:MAG TPA: hypothetical protein EYO93_03480 [Nitrososphaerales archaeon]|nr:hypothetical protein [Nitrososphaerales archaeon]NSL73465.1 hypothetical protein [Nitrososphaerota archaeon]NSL74454.1 hypothetical protein [Nitrososphaerota archaeon]NSL75294.1 hypothetical protein [Nitrososphaerota archaeon]NSL76183.1 hypothetical protein [Nitrososphaerota archaeon]